MTNGINTILKKLLTTKEYDILIKTDKVYTELSKKQKQWYKKTNFTCPPGCGQCCKNFEPDLYEYEALYLAAWLIQNQPEKAQLIADNKFLNSFEPTCILYNDESPYHCTVYNGRTSICRLFGASCSINKNNLPCWKPCKFYPKQLLTSYNPPIENKEYIADEIKQLFGIIPPIMTSYTEQLLCLNPNNLLPEPLRLILPKTIRKLYFIINLNNPDKNPTKLAS